MQKLTRLELELFAQQCSQIGQLAINPAFQTTKAPCGNRLLTIGITREYGETVFTIDGKNVGGVRNCIVEYTTLFAQAFNLDTFPKP